MTIKSIYDSKCALEHFFFDQNKKNSTLDPSLKILYKYSDKIEQIVHPGFKKPISFIHLRAFKNSNGTISKILQWTSDTCFTKDTNRMFFGRYAIAEENRVLINQRSLLKRLEKMENQFLEDYVKQIHYAPLEGNLERIFEEKRRAFASLKEKIEISSKPLIKGLDPKISDFCFTASISEKTIQEVFDHASNPARYALELQAKYPLNFIPSVPNPPLPNQLQEIPAQKSLFMATKNVLKTLKFPFNYAPLESLSFTEKRVADGLKKSSLALQRFFVTSEIPPRNFRHSDFSF